MLTHALLDCKRPQYQQRMGEDLNKNLIKNYADVLLSIFGNHTITYFFGAGAGEYYRMRIGDKHHCYTTIVPPVQAPKYPTRLETSRYYGYGYGYMAHTMKMPMTSLTFVSCGRPIRRYLAFKELISAYDTFSWLGILGTSIILIPMSLYAFQGTNSKQVTKYVTLLLKPIRVFLEQGDAFENHSLKVARLKYVVGPFILVGVVLSNAYKNDNVYNMVSPVFPEPYEEFSQLVRDDFKMYTKISQSGIHTNRHLISGNVCIVNITKHRVLYHSRSPAFENSPSECIYSDYPLSRGSDIWWGATTGRYPFLKHWLPKFKNNTTTFLENLINNTDILQESTLKFVEEMHIDFKKEQDYITGLERAYGTFVEKQKTALFNILDECQRSAVITSQIDARKTSVQLRNKGHRDVYVQ